MQGNSDSSDNHSRRKILKAMGGTIAATTAAQTVSADGGWSGGDNSSGECQYSRSCQYDYSRVEFVTEYQLEYLCSSVPAGIGIWSTAAAAIDPIPGNALLLGATATAGGIACDAKDGFIDMHGKPTTVKEFKWTTSGSGVERGDRYLVPGKKNNDWWNLW